MKKHLAMCLAVSLVFFGCAQANDLGSEPLEEVSFNGSRYSIEWSEEFTNERNLKILCLEQPCGPGNNWYNKTWSFDENDKEAIKWHTGSNDTETQLTKIAGGYGTEYIVENGALKITSSSKRVPNLNKPSTYHYYDSIGMYHTPSVVGAGCYIEVKFKTPKKQGFNFTIYANSPHYFSNGAKPAAKISDNYIMQALDFMELTTTGNKCPDGSILPHGKATIATLNNERLGDAGMSQFSTKNKNYYKTYNVGNEWFEEWHVFRATVEETSIKVWLDDTLFCEDYWTCGKLPEKSMELVFGNDQVGMADNAQSKINYNGTEPYTVTSYIEYVKVGQKVK